MVSLYLFSFTLSFATVSGLSIPPDAAKELYDIIANGIFTFPPCFKVEVCCSKITYTLYTRHNLQNGASLDSSNLNAVDPQIPVYLIIHGTFENAARPWVNEMKDEFLNQGPANVIVMDYGAYSFNLPSKLVCMAPKIGKCLGDFIYDLKVVTGLDPKAVHINAFSLGCQIAGSAGQEVQSKTGGAKIGRIDCMEAAGPGFLNVSLDKRLDKGDALFVQGIHTNSYMLGYPYPYATVDFFVNCGRKPLGCGALQPGCPLITGIPITSVTDLVNNFVCHHIRSVALYLESMNSTKFIGAKCDSCKSFCLGLCSSHPTEIMGEYCPSTASGVHYLSTNAKPPFAKASEGIPDSPWPDFF